MPMRLATRCKRRAHCALLAAVWLGLLLALVYVRSPPALPVATVPLLSDERPPDNAPLGAAANRTWMSMTVKMVRPRGFDALRQWPPPVVVCLRSAPKEAALRQAIRDTWAADAWILGIPVLMFTGWSLEAGVNESLAEERSQHADLTISDFIDHYHMLSVKVREILRWHTAHSRPSALLTADTNAVVYPSALLAYVRNKRLALAAGVNATGGGVPAPIYGQCTCTGSCKQLKGPPVWRKLGTKFYLPQWAYEPDRFPHYCMGFATLMSSAAAQMIAASAEHVNRTYLAAFWTDDVLFSGVFGADWPPVTLHNDRAAFKTMPRGHRCPGCVAQHWYKLTDSALRNAWNAT